MKVLTVTITDKHVEDKCWQSILDQTYKDCQNIIFQCKNDYTHPNITFEKYRKCSDTREAARKIALASDADVFLFMDSDIVLPNNAVEEFVIQQRDDNRVIGGWYTVRNDPFGRWAAGRWVADQTFLNFLSPEKSLVMADMIGLGCAFIPRKVLESIKFRHGCDTISKNALDHGPMILGECGAFGMDVQDAGFKLYMNGDVVCEHLVRTK